MDDLAFDCTVLALALACICSLACMCRSVTNVADDVQDAGDVSSDGSEIDVMLHVAPREPWEPRQTIARRHSW